MLEIGSILERKYKILDIIGRGGMSVIYLARNERAAKTWAIKEVRKEGVINEQANLAGLIAETNLLKELHHKNIVSIIDVIDYEDSFIIVMDYIEGKDLKKIIDEEGAQPWERVEKWGVTICDIFGYLHSQNPPIIYRDLKPNNLMLTADDDIVLIDFGTARKFKNQSQADDTKPLGTIGYAAPEQYGGHGETDARTDIYTIGATLFHLLTGISPADPPFYGVTQLRNVNPVYEGSGWEKIIDKCCQQRREDRYQSCEELRYDIEHWRELGDDEVRKRKHKWGMFLGAVAVCAIGAIGMLTFTGLKNSVTSETYNSILSAASEMTDIKSAESQFKSALKIDPGRPDAYIKLLEAIEKDAYFDDSEISTLDSCLQEKNDGSLKNIEYLQVQDRETYDDIYYRIGLLYFFFHEKSDKDMADAAPYFGEVLNSEYLSEPKKNLAQCLYTIGTYKEKLKAQDSELAYDAYTYESLWENLCEMVEGNVSEKVGRPAYAIALYNQMAFIIAKDYKNFNNNGVTKAAMLEQLDVVQAGLENFKDNGQASIVARYEAAMASVETALKYVNNLK